MHFCVTTLKSAPHSIVPSIFDQLLIILLKVNVHVAICPDSQAVYYLQPY